MNFLDKLIQYDKDLLVLINSFGTENWDSFWLLVTNQLSWIPLYLLFLYLIFKSFGWKKTIGLMLLAALLVTFSDQFTVFLKNYFERLRPNRDPSINEVIRILKNNTSFSFVSGHATTSSAITLFMYLTLRKHYNYTILFFIWPVLFSYSRMYIGVHFPLDVFTGAILGLLIGYLFYKISLPLLLWIEKKY
ncbi:phosphatase PAP2 family protein [Lutimonas halocynthiae]|uniref:phosphatase PAP2 family protein n=1 Tax=Lutimonas halocynthiae TaxID=1446477 RepID=UPI0025B3A7EC|nr:phosphatase PAP2 family protein [Lutimonas halocynthiae]MDN3641523.1 phosphatase PAP2 family protein [Lutimonas halocynthiae]